MAATTELHHAAPRCLLRLWDRANGAFDDPEISPAFLEFTAEAERWRAPVSVSRADLARLIESSAVVLDRERHRLIHESDFARWGRRGGLETVRRYGRSWMAALALRRWDRISRQDLDAMRVVR